MIYDDDDDDDDEGLIVPSFVFGMILIFFRFLLLSLEIVVGNANSSMRRSRGRDQRSSPPLHVRRFCVHVYHRRIVPTITIT